MARRTPDEMKGAELAPLCIAARMEEAKKIEEALDAATVDYTFEIRELEPGSVFGVLFGSRKEGVVFLVRSEQFEFCAGVLEKAGLDHLIVN